MHDYFSPILLSNDFRFKICEIAAERGSLRTIMWAKKYGCPINKTNIILKAASYGNIDICKYLLKVDPDSEYDYFLLKAIYGSAAAGNFNNKY